MTEPADQPLLEEAAPETKPTRRRTTAAKARATAPKAAATKAKAVRTTKAAAAKVEPVETAKAADVEKEAPAAAKPRAVRKRTTKKSVVSDDAAASPEISATADGAPAVASEFDFSAPEATPSPSAAAPAPEPPTSAPAPAAAQPTISREATAALVTSAAPHAEEWSPSQRSKSAPKSKAKTPRGAVKRAEKPAEPAKAGEAPAKAAEKPAAVQNGAATPEATVAPAPAAAPEILVQAAPAASPAPPAEAAPAPAPPQPARKYPVYIPRHVAKQMEQQGQTAPIAVPADAVPEAALAAVEAARTEARELRESREHREHREPREPREFAPTGRQEPPPPREEELGTGEGIVEISGKGFGFIRDAKRGFAQHPSDIFVTPELVRRYNLRDGQWIKGETRRGGRGAQLYRLQEINGNDPEQSRILPAFDELTVISPMERIRMETAPERSTTRIIDMFAPIGKGQRGIIVAPPRTGKTTLLQHIADAVVKNHPDITLIILLVDERPEEVTEIKRTVPSAEVMASSNDMDVKSHTRIAQLAIERAKRLVESGKDVFVLLDSITRVGRAFNNAMAGGGRTMSGGVDARALEIPRKLFAAARNTEEAGSLTIIATALIETGSRMDDLIFQEFKGTGNMELVLDRKIADQRIYPAVDIFQSGTRREELLIPADELHKINIIRRGLAGHKPIEAIERLLFFLKKFPTNAQMLREIPG